MSRPLTASRNSLGRGFAGLQAAGRLRPGGASLTVIVTLRARATGFGEQLDALIAGLTPTPSVAADAVGKGA